jgi:hypothetical protein
MSHQFHLYDVSLENLSEATGQRALLHRALDRGMFPPSLPERN